MQRSKLLLVSAPALGCAVLWGLVECMALWRTRWTGRHRAARRRAAA